MSKANSIRPSVRQQLRASRAKQHAKNAANYVTIPADPYSPPIVRIDGITYRHANGKLVPRVKQQ